MASLWPSIQFWAHRLSHWGTTLEPILKVLTWLAGSVALYVWLRERKDRSTDVLLQIETLFRESCEHGRPLVDMPRTYDTCKATLKSFSKDRLIDASGGHRQKLTEQETQELTDTIAPIDSLLRFYVVLLGVRQARQVSDRALGTCYRFWLAHYYLENRSELRAYVNGNFPTLAAWLQSDTTWWRRLMFRRFAGRWWRPFFRPAYFWPPDKLILDPRRLRDS